MQAGHRAEKRHSRIGDFSLKLGVLFSTLLAVGATAAIKRAEIAPAASLKPDAAGNLRTDNIKELAANALNYTGEQSLLSVVAAGSVALVALIGGIAYTRRSHNRVERQERSAAMVKRAKLRTLQKTTLQQMESTVQALGEQTDAVIAYSRDAIPGKIRTEFSERALELEATRPKTFSTMSPLELVAAAQTNQAIRMREEPYYPPSNVGPTSIQQTKPPMSSAIYWSLASFKQYYDENSPQDTGYHAPIDIAQSTNYDQRVGVHHLMPDLLATPSVGNPDVTAAHPLIAPRLA